VEEPQLIAHERATRRKPLPAAAIQSINPVILRKRQIAIGKAAQAIFSSAQQRAFNQGMFDHDNSTRDHPPYGFSDLKQAWRAGWLAASQKKNEGLNSGRRACLDGKSA
jgi:hypothetical protein